MNKREFGKLYQKNFCGKMSKKISVNEAIKEIECFLGIISEAVKSKNKVKFMNVGTFEVLDKKPRKIADPLTKEHKIIYPKKDIRFKFSENAKKKLWETQ
ncbi:MAG: HU family DNA-binding protein [Fusobacterium sp.]|nr:HU family DNA-binding protein [Fusobacterium sp.]